jgi:hypothetical protein
VTEVTDEMVTFEASMEAKSNVIVTVSTTASMTVKSFPCGIDLARRLGDDDPPHHADNVVRI